MSYQVKRFSTSNHFDSEAILIPERIDLDMLIINFTPNEITINQDNPYLIKEKMAWIIGQIVNAKWSQKKKCIRVEGGWVPLYSPLLQNVIHNYKQYLSYLIRVKVIECTQSYSNHTNKRESKKYRFTSQYYTRKLRKCVAYNRKFINTINKNRNNPIVEEKYDYLKSWFDGLTCYIKEAKEQLTLRYPDSSSQIELYLNSFQRNINHGKGRFSIGSSNRLNTPICNMPKECRKALRFKGERLVELDIKNSIPMMSLALLDYQVLQKWKEINEIIITSTNKEIIRYTQEKRKEGNDSYSYMLVEMGISDDILLYREKVMDGTIYEYIANHWNSCLSKNYNREAAKKKFLSILNSPSSFECKELTELTKLFPTVMRLFSKINEGFIKTNKMVGNREWDHEKDGLKCPFAYVTQKIESWLVLERICKRISRDLPLAPVFTIHDAIYTTSENVKTVTYIIKDEFKVVLGAVGKVKVTNY